MPSPTLEEYLETIYKLSQDGIVKPAQIAESAGVSGPTVTATLKRLEQQGLIERTGTDVFLTEAGIVAALGIVRRHRVAERFLVDILGLDWEAAHEDACFLEHAMSERVLVALEEYLDNPDVCPHGHPIPTADGLMAAQTVGHSLADGRIGERAKVIRVAEHPLLLGYLGGKGLKPGAMVEVVDRDGIGGVLVLDVDGAAVTVTMGVAREVIVEPSDIGSNDIGQGDSQ
ncbi:MAG: metal-dependent transcriptional regulator [Coriobacteriia bacterium]|nr:metal-dependent transcriptional regulator [Coriobacteriia bacterium]